MQEVYCSSVSRILRKALIKRKDKKIDLKNCKNLYIRLLALLVKKLQIFVKKILIEKYNFN
ncbi:hypothetical protein [Spiroplasma poulsonii]|uniref:hypothetical protein n=1 Tax=Spiroplasma poulsonii TaxID=2138 RepID=UPI000F8E11E5|nr:hypothetical protein [Spiroplasma poulsonii]